MTSTRILAKEAALRLLQNGERPTADRVRNTIGKGSQQTILSALDEFWGEIGGRLNEPRLPEALLGPMNTLWTQAVREAGRQWDAERSSLEARTRVLEEGLSGAEMALSNTQVALRHSQKEAGEAHEHARRQGERLAELERDIQALQEESNRLATQGDQLKELLRVEREGRERDQTIWLKEIDTARQAVKTANAEKETLVRTLSQARDAQVRQELLLKQSEQTNTDLDARLKAKETQLEAKSEAHECVLAESIEQARRIERLESEVSQRQTELFGLKETLQKKEQAHATLMDSSASIRLQAERLRAENQMLRDEIASLRSNRAEIEHFFQLLMERLGDAKTD